MLDRARESGNADLALDALPVAQELKAHLVNDEAALAANDLDLPYSRSVANVQSTHASDLDEAQRMSYNQQVPLCRVGEPSVRQ